jgi:FG-GAP repeat protein
LSAVARAVVGPTGSAALLAGGLALGCGPSEGGAGSVESQADDGLDLAQLGDTGLRRVYGSTGDGSLGLPVAGGSDVDGDGHLDAAFGAMQASPLGVPHAGEVFLLLNDGSLSGAIDSAASDPRILRLRGSQPYEYSGSELWLDDVTGDGIGDVLIARQNHSSSPDRRAAGALSIVSGGPALRARSSALEPVALDDPGADLQVLTLVGAAAGSRLGIWLRTGDVTGDGIADLLVAADQETAGAANAGAVYLIAGGPHLSTPATIGLDAVAGTALAGNVARVIPPALPEPRDYHFGATCQLADLDGNGRAELLIAAALNRAGAVLDVDGGFDATGNGGPAGGALYIVWDDNIPPPPWPDGFGFAADAGTGSYSQLAGGAGNGELGEELLGGLDWDIDGAPDLFVGDLLANLRGRPAAGASYVIYDAQRLRGLRLSVAELATLEPPIRTTTIIGAGTGDISGDTAAQGDFSGDGVADLVVCSPHHNPLYRHYAGALHVLYGRAEGWPAVLDLHDLPPRSELDVLPVFGAHGSFGNDRGDTLCYSAATGDLDADGRTDLIVNEMVGNGLSPEAINVGNMLLLGGRF